nr:MAG TPA: hypothetical protein [Caudoviricetes sp.]
MPTRPNRQTLTGPSGSASGRRQLTCIPACARTRDCAGRRKGVIRYYETVLHRQRARGL